MMNFATRSVLRGSIKVNRLYTAASSSSSSTRIPSGFASATSSKSNSSTKSSPSPINSFNNKTNNIFKSNATNNSSLAFGIVEFMVFNGMISTTITITITTTTFNNHHSKR
ncbi:hypothetical protein ACTFIZ_011303 [Dictyostelium cf. discoideum]